MDIDITSYVLGVDKGRSDPIVIESDTYQFTDPDSDGNIVITEV